ncbi:MAG: hypothetical protein ACREV7_18560, partial [Steroidobacteraceae bacterium]
ARMASRSSMAVAAAAVCCGARFMETPLYTHSSGRTHVVSSFTSCAAYRITATMPEVTGIFHVD